jgi:hypothetical protein
MLATRKWDNLHIAKVEAQDMAKKKMRQKEPSNPLADYYEAERQALIALYDSQVKRQKRESQRPKEVIIARLSA